MDKMTAQRGEIYNRRRSSQLNDFTGLRYDKITPTDIDGAIDFGGKVFVFIELKYNGAEMPYGQRLCLERIVDAIASGGKVAICLVAEHHTDAEYDVDVGLSYVIEYRYDYQWREPQTRLTVREALDMFLEQHAPNFLGGA